MSIFRRVFLTATIILALLFSQGCAVADIFMPPDGYLIPSSAQIIEDYAFYQCAAMEGELVLPSGVTSIGDYAFYGCRSITGEFALPPDLTHIGAYAFSGCAGLTGSPYIPESVTVGEGAFDGSSIRPVYPADFAYEIKDGGAVVTGYRGSDVSALRIPDRLGGAPVTAISSGAFEGRTDISGPLSLPDTIASIGDNAFAGCANLTGKLVLPDALSSLGENAFAGCAGLTGSVLLPEALAACPESAFSGTALSVVSYQSYASQFLYSVSGGCATVTGFDGATGFGLRIPSVLDGAPVTAIADRAFRARADIKGSIRLPDTLLSIGAEAFLGCTGLTGTLSLPASLEAIGHRAFRGCSGLTGGVTVPEAVISMGSSVFDGTDLAVSYAQIVGLTLYAPKNHLALGHSMKLSVYVVPEDGDSSVIWSVSDPAVASVDDTGLVTGLANGTVTITATSAVKPALSSSVTLTVSQKPVYRALLIGNIYPGTRNYLPGCETDITAMASMLRSMNDTPYDLTIKRDLSAGGMLAAIPEAFAGATEYDVSLVYYTGHGDSGGGRLVGVDGTYLSFASLRTALDAIPGKKIVILDSCFSGHAIGKSIAAEAEASDIERVNRAVIEAFSASAYTAKSGELASDRYYVLTAARAAQQSGATSESGVDYSLFTRCLLRGSGYDQITSEYHALRADTDLDGGITLDESYVYVRDHLDEIAYFNQDVQVWPENSDMLMWGQER